MKLTAEDVAKMSHEEKLHNIEIIWAEIAQHEADIPSPQWHKDCLDETDRQFAAGEAGIMEWEDAKRELRKMFD